MAGKVNRSFEHWTFSINGVTEKVSVRIQEDKDGLFFRAFGSPTKLDLRDTDIRKLKKECQRLLEDHHKLEWKPYLYVTVHSDIQPDSLRSMDEVPGFGTEANISLKVEWYELTHDKKGNPLKRDRRCTWPMPKWPDVGPDDDSLTNTKMRALIPDTPENRAALVKIFEGYDRVTKMIETLMSPEKIKETLERVTQFPDRLLPFDNGATKPPAK